VPGRHRRPGAPQRNRTAARRAPRWEGDRLGVRVDVPGKFLRDADELLAQRPEPLTHFNGPVHARAAVVGEQLGDPVSGDIVHCGQIHTAEAVIDVLVQTHRVMSLSSACSAAVAASRIAGSGCICVVTLHSRRASSMRAYISSYTSSGSSAVASSSRSACVCAITSSACADKPRRTRRHQFSRRHRSPVHRWRAVHRARALRRSDCHDRRRPSHRRPTVSRR
jgi:hypothetical protein